MASPRARNETGLVQPLRRLVPVGVVVVVYFVAGTLWVVGSGPGADMVMAATSMARWVVELALGLLFVSVTTLVLSLSMRGRAERLDAADERTEDADARSEAADVRTDQADVRTDRANARTSAANARTHVKTRELALSEDRNRLQEAALSGTSTAVVVTSCDGRIEWANEAFGVLSGYSTSELLGGTPRLLKSGLHDEDLYREMWTTILAGQVWHGEMVNRRPDGELYTVSQTITPVLAPGGAIQNFVATLEDITERVRAADALEASRVRLQALVDHALDAIVLADDGGRFVEVNPAFCDLTGYSRTELLSMGPADLADPDREPADVATQFDEFVRARTESGTFTLRRRDGQVVETEYRAVSSIQPGVHLSVLRDVTERNRMLQALTTAESEFRELAEKAADIVARLRVDDDGRVQVAYVNPAATTILGYPQQHLREDPDLLLRLFDGRGDDLADALDLRPTAAAPVRLATVQVQRADGGMVWLEVHSAITDASAAPATIQLVARDVTARSEMTQALEQALEDQLEAAEQLRTLNAMKDAFLQTVSHELRTPLTSIMGFAHLLADPKHGLSPGNTQEFHTRILSNTQRLQRLLDDLLDVDRYTRGAIEARRAPTDLTALIEQMIHDVGLDGHPVDLDLEPITMDLDASLVERLVTGVLRNIVRHTPADSSVWIRARATAGRAELTFDDDGPGIPEVDRLRVIEPFQQGTEAAASAQPGTGIGLTLVNTFAQLHGGHLVIGESDARGTRVTVTLNDPRPGATPTAAAASEEIAPRQT